jgi:hypothetical protein
MSKWTNFNDAEDQTFYTLIPHRTIAKVVMLIKKGGYVTSEFLGGYATKSDSTGSVYLACEFVILNGEYENRKIWGYIGLHSDNSEKYGEIGRTMIKAILNSAYSIHPKDNSPDAVKQREIKNFADLDNLEFIAEITINDKGQNPKNEIKTIITPDHAKYIEYMDSRNSKVKVKINYNQPKTEKKNEKFVGDEVPF